MGNTVLLAIINSLVIFTSSNQIVDSDDVSRCDIDQKHWTLIKWYFERCTFIEITEIAVNQSHTSDFSNHIIRGLMTETQRSVQTHIVDQFYDEPNITFTDTFRRNAQQFEPWDHFRNTTKKASSVRRTTRQYARFKFRLVSKMARHDEPELAAFIYSNSLDIIEDYLVGPPRHPFYKPRGNFIIMATRKGQTDWMESGAAILEVLWRDYRVFNVVIMAPCEDDQQVKKFRESRKLNTTEHTDIKKTFLFLTKKVVGFYDPFDPDPDPDVDHKLKSNWGVMKWMDINDIDLESGWLLRKGRHFKGYPFKASTFARYPTMVESISLPKSFLSTHYANGAKFSGGLAGFDGLVLGNLAEVYNFQTIRVASISYGATLPDHSFSGSMGDVLYRRADANLNGRFIIDYGSNEIEFIHPVFADQFCVIAPSALQIPGWKAIFRCYSMGVWSGILATVFVCTFCWHFLKKLELEISSMEKGMPKNLAYSKLNNLFTDMIMLITGGTIQSRSFLVMERILIGSCLIFNIIIAGTFQGSLTTSFSTKAYESEIDTLEQLDRSGLPIVSSANTIKNFFGTDNNTVRNSLQKKFFIENITALRITADERRMSTVERSSDIRIIIKTTYEDGNGKSSLHVVKECPRDYHLGYIVRKGFPFFARFKDTLLRFFESGFLMKWYVEVENSLIAQVATKKRADNPIFSFNLEDMQTAFYILGIGWLTCLAALALEKLFPEFSYF